MEKGSYDGFGIPLKAGRVTAKGKQGVIVSFNLDHLLMRQVVGVQLFKSDRSQLSPFVNDPTPIVNLFGFPESANPPLVGFSQREREVYLFINLLQAKAEDDIRVVFWFVRYPKPVTTDDDLVDLPPEWIPLALAILKKHIHMRQQQPVPQSVEETIRVETERIRSIGNPQNYYLGNTITLNEDDLALMGRSDLDQERTSCFISYSSKDEEFAARLYADLQTHGVKCWFASEDLMIGQKIRPGIDEAIRIHDKLLLVLSKSSVKSEWVEKEVETAFEKERKENKTVLFPVRVDEAVFDTEVAWAADIRRTRHIGDFRNWQKHADYKKAFDRLLRDLKADGNDTKAESEMAGEET
ncbi:MAG: toll/interleukin-1 receptor domain-containing protein [Bacteroidota bacterium]